MSRDRHDTPVLNYRAADPSPHDDELSARERLLLRLVNQRVVMAPTLSGVLDALFDDAAPVLPCDRMGLAFVDDDGASLTAAHVVAGYRPLRLRQGYRAPLAGSSLEQVIRQGTPRLIGDLEQYLAEHPGSASTRLCVAEGIRSSLTCPLRVDDRPVGVLFLSSLQPWAFGELEVRLVQAVTDRLSRVVERAWRQHRAETVSHAYEHDLDQAARQVRGTAAALLDDLDALRSGRLGPLTAAQQERLERMARLARGLSGVLDTPR
jgi:GAF domain-containing protein